MKTAKPVSSLLASIVLLLLGVAGAGAAIAPFTEIYGTASDGTILHWLVYTPSGAGPWPAVLVIHGGDFNAGTPDYTPDQINCSEDLAAAGYIVFSIEYRLAPPGSLPGQTSLGQFPDQTDDVKLAVQAARQDSRCNGLVGAVGGSAGGSHTVYVAGTGTLGDDRIDVGIDLSGAHDFSDFNPAPNIVNFKDFVLNYVGVTSDDITDLRAASPAWAIDKDVAPLFIVNSLGDSMPYVQLPDLIEHLDALGVTNYKVRTLTGANHSFANWPDVKDDALAFLAAVFNGSPTPTPTPSPSPVSKQLVNVSTRANVGVGDNVMIGGFVVSGDTDKRVVLRGLGPSLAQFGVGETLTDPFLALYDSTGALVESNDNRVAIPGIRDPLLPDHPAESLLIGILPPGNYTAILSGVDLGTGDALVEVYDVDEVDSRLGNISTRAVASTKNDQMIGGFIIGGTDPTDVIVRALGPSLATSGVTDFLPDPVLELHDENGAVIATNDNWRSDQEQEIIDSGFPPGNDQEAAIVATLPAGAYTAVIHDAQFTTGVALFDAYDLDLP